MARDLIYFADIPKPPSEAPPRQLFEYAATASLVIGVGATRWNSPSYATLRRIVERYLRDWHPKELEENP